MNIDYKNNNNNRLDGLQELAQKNPGTRTEDPIDRTFRINTKNRTTKKILSEAIIHTSIVLCCAD